MYIRNMCLCLVQVPQHDLWQNVKSIDPRQVANYEAASALHVSTWRWSDETMMHGAAYISSSFDCDVVSFIYIIYIDITLYFPYKLSQTHHSWTSVNIIQRSQSFGSTPRLPRMSMSSTGPVAYPRGWPPGAPSQRQKAPWGSTWKKFGNPRPFRSGIQWWVTSWTCSCPPPFEILLFKVTFSKFLFKLSFQKSETTEKREKTQCTSYHPYNPFTPNPPAVISKRLNMTIHSNAIKCISTIFALHFLESHFQLPTSPKKRAHMCSTTPSPKQPSTTLQQL